MIGFYIFEVSSSLLNSRRRLQDVETETIRSERVENHLCLRVEQQDKLNAKRIIHGIFSIFRLFLYQITKFVLTVSRRIHFLSSIHQHLNHAPQEKKKRQTSAKRHDDIVTPQLPRYNKLNSSSSENTSAEIRPISCELGASSDGADDVAERTIVSKE